MEPAMSYTFLIFSFVPAAIVSGSLIGFGVWLVKKHLGPAYHVAGVAAIVLGALCSLGAGLVLIGFLAFTGPPLDSG